MCNRDKRLMNRRGGSARGLFLDDSDAIVRGATDNDDQAKFPATEPLSSLRSRLSRHLKHPVEQWPEFSSTLARFKNRPHTPHVVQAVGRNRLEINYSNDSRQRFVEA